MNLFYLKLDLKMILKNLYHFNKAQWLTRNIRKPGAVGNLKFSIYAQNCNGLTSWSFEIPASAYCHRCSLALGFPALITDLQNVFFLIPSRKDFARQKLYIQTSLTRIA